MSHFKGSIKKVDEICTLKWIKLNKITYIDCKGNERLWESASRTTKKGDTDAVDIIATVNKDNKKYLIVVVQYRPPVDNLVIEFPAGLVDGDEDPVESAIRELKEETGFFTNKDKVLLTSPTLPLECGMSDANCRIVAIDLDQTICDKQELEETENIEVYYLPMDNLLNELEELKKKLNCLISASLYSFALGLSFKC